jgi:hypothetical protein
MTPEPKKRSYLHGLWEWWKRVGRKIGDVQARILLTLFYMLIFGPFALVIRFWSDPLRLKTKHAGWIPRLDREENAEKRAHEQF